MSDTTDWITAVSGAFAAVGTVGAVAVALFPEWFRKRFSPTVAEILLPHGGELTFINDGGDPDDPSWKPPRVIMLHLTAVNRSRSTTLRRCVLVLVEISQRQKDGQWSTTVLAVPQHLQWAPAGSHPMAVNIPPGGSAIADFGAYAEGPEFPQFSPILPTMPLNFPGIIYGDGALRYHVELRAENLDEIARATIEVVTTGGWGIDRASMLMQVQARRIFPTPAPQRVEVIGR